MSDLVADAPGVLHELFQVASRTDLVRGHIEDGFVHSDLEAPPYFSKNVVHDGS